jgi:hypothetical protein
VEPLEDFEANKLAPPWNHRLSLNNQSVSYRLQGRGEVEPLEDLEASILASPWNHRLSLNNQSVSYQPASGPSRSEPLDDFEASIFAPPWNPASPCTINQSIIGF